MIESLDHAGRRLRARSLAEARVELGRVILAVAQALGGGRPHRVAAAADERMAVEAALARGRGGDGRDQSDTQAAAAQLTRDARAASSGISEPFAARRMQRALPAGMAGKSLHEIEAALAEEGIDAKRGGHSAEMVRTTQARRAVKATARRAVKATRPEGP